MDMKFIQMRKNGSITIPVEYRKKYDLKEGDSFTLIDKGDGSFTLSPGVPTIDQLSQKINQLMEREGVTLEDMLNAMQVERERYYKENYQQE
jgi:AbrB family looped-hinge helix DNA binding protein